MKIRTHLKIDRINRLASSTSQLLGEWDKRIKTGYQSVAHHILSPQSYADFTGLKKLIEKDYKTGHEDIAGSLANS
jgi:hypothetical protein